MSAPLVIFYICSAILLIGAIAGLVWWLRRRAETGEPIGYAPYFAGWFLTWPIISYMGGQGYSGLIGFLALPVLLFTRPRSLPIYTVLLGVFLSWAILTSTWSPAGGPLITGSFTQGSFAVNATSVRIGLTALACIGVLMALVHIEPGRARLSAATVRYVSWVQGAGVVVTAIFLIEILVLVEPVSDSRAEMPQNLLRNANSFLMLVPLLLAWIWLKPGLIWKAIAPVGLLVVAAATVATGSLSALLAVALMLAAIGIVWAFKRFGFAILFGAIGLYTLCAPMILNLIISSVRALQVPLPLSTWSRIHAWEATSEKISEAPLMGHGLQASRTWRDTFGDQPERFNQMVADSGAVWVWDVYPIIPRHPHNMPVQIWAETGLIGAALAAILFLALAWRFRDATALDALTRYSAAGLFGAVVSFYSFSYSMWNEAFWASVAVALGVIILQAKRQAPQ